jgi:hypothetical protein
MYVHTQPPVKSNMASLVYALSCDEQELINWFTKCQRPLVPRMEPTCANREF